MEIVNDPRIKPFRWDESTGKFTVDGTVIFSGDVSIVNTLEVQGTSMPTGGVERQGQKRTYNAGVLAKAGTASGWSVAAVDSVCLATLAQSLSSKALVVPITGLKVGDLIASFHLIGQVESAGNNVTINADLRKHTAAAADVADASVGAMDQLVVNADTILSSANASKDLTVETVGVDETFYVLITATTGANTDIALQGVAVVMTEN